MRINTLLAIAIPVAVLLTAGGCAGPGLFVYEIEQEALHLSPRASRSDLYTALRSKTWSRSVRRELSQQEAKGVTPYRRYLEQSPWEEDAFSMEGVSRNPPDVLSRAAYIEGFSVKEGAHGNGFIYVIYGADTNYIGFVSLKQHWSQ